MFPVFGRGVTVEPGGTGAPELSYCGGLWVCAEAIPAAKSRAAAARMEAFLVMRVSLR